MGIKDGWPQPIITRKAGTGRERRRESKREREGERGREKD